MFGSGFTILERPCYLSLVVDTQCAGGEASWRTDCRVAAVIVEKSDALAAVAPGPPMMPLQYAAARSHMNGWNRLFVVVAVVWALAAPFLLAAVNNAPVERMYSFCTDVAYEIYGSSSSAKLDLDRHRAEVEKCSKAFVRDFLSVPGLFGAMIGVGDWKSGIAMWGFILIPLALLWIVGWGVGRLVLWVATGFRR